MAQKIARGLRLSAYNVCGDDGARGHGGVPERQHGGFDGLPRRPMFLAFLPTGPINTLLIESVPVNLRARAMATSIFVIHLLGDFWSPVIVGRLADGGTGPTIRGPDCKTRCSFCPPCSAFPSCPGLACLEAAAALSTHKAALQGR